MAALCALFTIPGLAQEVMVEPLPYSALPGKKVLLLEDFKSGAHHDAAMVVQGYWEEFAGKVGFELTVTGNLSDFTTANLANYDIVVFNYSGNMADKFNSSQQKAFEEYMLYGGNWIGYHTASMPREGQWDWYRHNVILGLYTPNYHGLQDGTMLATTDTSILNSPIMEGMPRSFSTNDEWYAFSQGDFFDQAKVMFYIDESTMKGHDHKSLGNIDAYQLSLPVEKRHPIMWYRENPENQGRVFYTGLVHNPAGARTDFFKLMVLRSAEWVAGTKPLPVSACPDPGYLEYREYRRGDDASLCRNRGIADDAALRGDRFRYWQADGTLRIRAAHRGNYTAALMDMSGRKLREVAMENRTQAEFSTQGLSPGIYWVRMVRAGRTVSLQRIAVRG